ncbi:MAG TPA: phosphopantetheine-binding protein [Pirellulaceae bacterium]|nr:phosphopantetheine-binding protein [Pirellulaceae bacterium]
MPSEPDKRERIISLVAEQLGVPRELIADRMPDLDGIAIDSLDVAELALEIEEEFGDDWKLP